MSSTSIRPNVGYTQLEIWFFSSALFGYILHLTYFEQYYGKKKPNIKNLTILIVYIGVCFSRYRRRKSILGWFSGIMSLLCNDQK